VHSALVHGRRAMPGGEDGPARFFSDISYCQHSVSRSLWPSYQLFHKPGCEHFNLKLYFDRFGAGLGSI
jgi:hypothetical protein